MSYAYGDVSYSYKVRINLSSFLEAILSQIDGSDDYELDGDTLIITGTSNNRAKSDYTPATLYDPPEYECDFIEDTIESLNFEQIVVDACNTFKESLMNDDKSISDCELDAESFDFEADEDYGPDPDEAYDKWRDSQLDANL